MRAAMLSTGKGREFTMFFEKRRVRQQRGGEAAGFHACRKIFHGRKLRREMPVHEHKL